MACRFVFAPSFPLLLDRLLDQVEETCRRELLPALWLLVPSSTCGNHLRRRLARRAGSSALGGVQVRPLPRFFEHLAERAGLPEASRWSPAHDLLLRVLVGELDTDSPLQGLGRMSGAHRLLRTTFLDLADAGFGREQEELLQEAGHEPDLLRVEAETLNLYTLWLRLLQAHDLDWEPLRLQRLSHWLTEAPEADLHRALSGSSDQSPQLMTYGFYDLTDLNLEALTRLAERVSVHHFIPYRRRGRKPHPGFTFVHGLIEDLTARLGGSEPSIEEVSVDLPESTDYFLETFPDGPVPDLPAFLSVQRACGVRAELVSAAVRIRTWVDDPVDPLRPEEILVTAPDAEPYLDELREVFKDFAIPLRLSDVPAGLTPEDLPLREISRIWADQAPAEWILAFLRDTRALSAEKGGKHPPPLLDSVPLEEFESRLRETGIWGGSSWECLTPRDLPDLSSQRLEHGPRFTEAELRLVSEIRETWVASASAPEAPLSMDEALRLVDRLESRWAPGNPSLELLKETLKRAARGPFNLPLTRTVLMELLQVSIHPRTHSDPPGGAGVLFTPLMRARGVTARGLVLLGMATGRLPFRVDEDPLLSDASRRRLSRLAHDVGHRLPFKTESTAEMTLLFLLANTSAERVHWVIPEADENGRTVSPTPWAQRYLRRQPPVSGLLDRRVSRGPAQQAAWLSSLDSRRGSLLPPASAVYLEPDVARLFDPQGHHRHLLETGADREAEPVWNGLVPEAALPAEGREDRVTVTGLEVLSRCPYRFYAEQLRNWRGLSALTYRRQLNALEAGSFLHELLEEIFAEASREGLTLGETAARFLQNGAGRLQDWTGLLARSRPIVFDRFPSIFRQQILDRLTATAAAYLEILLEGARSGDHPRDVERKIRTPFPGRPGLNISGVIDRVDRAGSRIVILDYKNSSNYKDLDREVRWGYRLQPVLYPLLLRADEPGNPSTEFRYVFLKEDPPREVPVAELEPSVDLLESLGTVLADGTFLPTSQEALRIVGLDEKMQPCRFCEYVSLCRRFDHGAALRFARLLRRMLPGRLVYLEKTLEERS